MPELHVYKNDCDWYVAASPEDAANACHEHTEVPLDEIATFVPLADDSPLTVTDEDDEPPKLTKTCAEWARSNGRGFLCSTES